MKLLDLPTVPAVSDGYADGGCYYTADEMDLMRQQALAPYMWMKIDEFIEIAARIPRMTKDAVVMAVANTRNLTICHARVVVDYRWPTPDTLETPPFTLPYTCTQCT